MYIIRSRLLLHTTGARAENGVEMIDRAYRGNTYYYYFYFYNPTGLVVKAAVAVIIVYCRVAIVAWEKQTRDTRVRRSTTTLFARRLRLRRIFVLIYIFFSAMLVPSSYKHFYCDNVCRVACTSSHRLYPHDRTPVTDPVRKRKIGGEVGGGLKN